MPARKIQINGEQWSASPSGYVTQYDQDEYGVLFTRGSGADRVMRVTRYSPGGTRSREASFMELSDARLTELFHQSQPGSTSPEAGYTQ